MGGNTFKNLETLRRIKREEISSTLEYVVNLLDYPGLTMEYVNDSLLGSTGKKDSSGDIDIAMNTHNSEAFTKKVELFDKHNFLKRLQQVLPLSKINTTCLRMGVIITAFPIDGKEDNGHIQIDFLFGNREFLKFSHYSPGAQSKFPGVFVSQTYGVLAKEKVIFKILSDIPLNGDGENRLAVIHYVYNLENGLHLRYRMFDEKTKTLQEVDADYFETNCSVIPPRMNRAKFYSNPEDVIRILFGDKYTFDDVNTFEKIVNILRNDLSPEKFDAFRLRFSDSILRSGAKHIARENGWLNFENHEIWSK